MTRPRRARVLATGLLSCAVVLTSACSKEEPKSGEAASASQPAGGAKAAAGAQADRGTPSAVYVVRGHVTVLPSATSEFHVHHEAIDNFTDCQGKVVGMSAMDMPFPLMPGVSVEGLSVKDPVRVTFSVWCSPRLTYAATKIEKLSAEEGATITFRAANTEGQKPATAPAPASAPEAPKAGG